MEAFSALRRAFEYYVETGQVAPAVTVAEFPINSPVYRIPGVAEMLTRALTLVPAESHEAGRLLSRYVCLHGNRLPLTYFPSRQAEAASPLRIRSIST